MPRSPVCHLRFAAIPSQTDLENLGARFESHWVSPDRTVFVGVTESVSWSPCSDPTPVFARTTAAEMGAAYVAAGGRWPDHPIPVGATVIVDFGRSVVLAATDPMGVHHVCYAVDADSITLGESASSVAAATDRTRISLQALYEYVYFHMVPAPITVFEGVSKLPAGHLLEWSPRASYVRRYWAPAFASSTDLDEPEAGEELFACLRRAVRRSVGDRTDVGAFLSGGLDSSTMAGLVAECLPGAKSVSMGFEAQGYDEMHYARVASRHFGTTALEYYVQPADLIETIGMIAASFDEPFGNSSAAAAFHCARIAREHGISRLVAGDGGDEIFGGNDRYALQMIFERYNALPGFVRHGIIDPAVRIASLPAHHGPVRKARSFLEQTAIPLPDRMQRYNFLNQLRPSDVFSSRFLAGTDGSLPLQRLRDQYAGARCDGDDPVNRMLFMDWEFTLHDNDLVKVNSMCRLAGVDVSYPMLDPELVMFSCRIPADWKVRRRELRWFYRRAMRGFLPDEILAKRKHGFGLPFGVWTRTDERLRSLAADTLHSIDRRGYFRPGFIEEALRLHREEHAGYYGELVWILMTLELWLQANSPSASI